MLIAARLGRADFIAAIGVAFGQVLALFRMSEDALAVLAQAEAA